MLIGLSGKAQSGKDTVYKMMVYTLYYWRYYNTKKSEGYIEYDKEYSIDHMEYIFSCLYDLDQNIYKYSFASKLKECLSALCNVPVSFFEDINFKNSKVQWLTLEGKHPTIRELLQKFGTAIRNEVCSDFWVQAAFNNIKNIKHHTIVFTDVRFKSEAEAIKNKGGVLVRINRKEAGAGNHISETELDDYKFDIVINNNGDLSDLLEQVRVLMKNFCLI